jgi:predicted NAD-dependent protein-ADP-ribosyltransferase YbiA (DUF1768 family)
MEAAPKADKKFLKDGSMILPHNTVSINGEDLISLSGRTVKDSKELISDRLSGYATAFVDVAKDPYIMKIIKSDLIVGTFMFLERVGAGPKAIKFLNQPIISEYISMLDNLNTKNLYNKDNIDLIKMIFDTVEDPAGIDISDKHLDENIENYYIDKELSPAQNAEQHAILDEFLKYAKMADYNFKFTQATNYDTTKFRSGDTLSRKQMRTATALKTNIISSVDDILNNTFIGEQERLLSEFAKATGEIFKLEQDQFRVIIDSVLEPYKANEYMSQDNYEKIANKIRSSLVDYAVQINKGYNTNIKSLLVDINTSIAKQLSDAKEKYKDSKILNDLEIESSPRPGGAMTVKLNVNLKDAYDENLYTGMMAELRDNPDTRELYNNLVVISILQGSYQSAVSIKNIIPIEDYSAIVAPIISGLQSSPDIEAFSKIGSFQRTNFKDDDIMPVLQPKFFLASEAPVYAQTNQFGDHYADIFQYYSSMFPNIEQLKIKSTDRRVLLLSEKYNSFDLKNDFVKIPRVVTDRVSGDSIDMLTGETITPKSYAERKAKGDMTLNDVIGYKKVKYKGSGEPVITTDSKGNDHHVYKMINLRGDGQYATEHYTDDRMSVLNNGTMKIDFEIPDEDIIEFYGGEPSELDFEQVEENVVPSQTKTEPVIDSSKKINIYAGTGENAELSNFANRPTTYNTSAVEGFFGTPEGAFQAAKISYTENLTDEQKIDNSIIFEKLKSASGSQAKSLGRTIKGLNQSDWNNDSSDVMLDILIDSFRQNPNALAKLLATGNAELTHTQDTGKWGKEFPRLLMEVREELRPIEAVTNVKISTPSGKLKLKDGNEYLISDINSELLKSIGYKPTEIGKLLKSIC